MNVYFEIIIILDSNSHTYTKIECSTQIYVLGEFKVIPKEKKVLMQKLQGIRYV